MILGMLFIPTFEYFAKFASWWAYRPSEHMLFYTPDYIVLGEGLICLILPAIFSKVFKMNWITVLIWGAIIGLWIFAAYFLSYTIIGK